MAEIDEGLHQLFHSLIVLQVSEEVRSELHAVQQVVAKILNGGPALTEIIKGEANACRLQAGEVRTAAARIVEHHFFLKIELDPLRRHMSFADLLLNGALQEGEGWVVTKRKGKRETGWLQTVALPGQHLLCSCRE